MKGTGGMRRFRKKVRRFVRLYWFWVSLGLVLTKVSVEAAYILASFTKYPTIITTGKTSHSLP